ncbi:MAG: hypothetical protein ACOYKF_10405, partial [Phenylobacterium sp.]
LDALDALEDLLPHHLQLHLRQPASVVWRIALEDLADLAAQFGDLVRAQQAPDDGVALGFELRAGSTGLARIEPRLFPRRL